MTDYGNDAVPAGYELPAGEPGPFAPCVLLIDSSSSMSISKHGARPAMDEVNDGLKMFADEVKRDELAGDRADIILISFHDDEAEIKAGPVLARDFQPPMLTTSGLTPMGKAIQTGLDTIQTRRKEYKRKGVEAYAAMMFLLTDGQPTDQWGAAAAAAASRSEAGELNLFCIGTKDANFDILKQISCGNAPVELKDGAFKGLFKWISDSLSTVSRSQPKDTVQVARPDQPDTGWGSIHT